MIGQIRFWFSPSTETFYWFAGAAAGLCGFIVCVRVLHSRLLGQRQQKELAKRLAKADLLGRPEEAVVREIVEKYHITPPSSLLTQLQVFDQAAGEEIERVEKAKMPLPERIDRIEYLYSIRLQAFAHEPSVGGIDVLLGEREKPAAVLARAPSSEDGAKTETEEPVPIAPIDEAIHLDEKEYSDFEQLVADPEMFGSEENV